jgi:hypothetical protein
MLLAVSLTLVPRQLTLHAMSIAPGVLLGLEIVMGRVEAPRVEVRPAMLDAERTGAAAEALGSLSVLPCAMCQLFHRVLQD